MSGARARPAAWALAALALLGALACGGCANTLQDKPVAPSILEPLVTQEEFPVYWLGGTFRGLAITRVERDPSGAYEIQYGNCVLGGESSCVTPLEIVTSPDNGFVPGGEAASRTILLRGVHARSAAGGRAILVPTGDVVVDLYADGPALARAAAETMVAINSPAGDTIDRSPLTDRRNRPGAPLPPPLPSTGYGERPLPSQQPSIVPAGAQAALRAASAS
jgi:hypothetical protein